MLKIGSAQIVVVGFRRTPEPPKDIEGCETIDLGLTKDGELFERIGSVVMVALRLEQMRRLVSGCQVVLARNLEMLFLATKARRRYAPSAALVYECLDIHRLLLRDGFSGRLLRRIETRLIGGVDLIVTSSPRFISEYFKPRNFGLPIKVLENKLLASDFGVGRPSQPARISGPPWKIGWFGMIRCRRSFEVLSRVAREADGNLQVRIAGRPSPKEFPDFDSLLAAAPHVGFTGSYRFDELPALYGDVHFSWAVDYFERGLNSSWLLPNRIYESSFFGAVPIAVEGVETTRWLAEKKIGVTLVGQPETSLCDLVMTMNDRRYRELFDALQRIPTSELAETPESCRQLIEAFEKLTVPGQPR
jgi:hypothetical protein